jgi:hypothetical protein
MTEKKGKGFLNLIKEGLSNISQILVASIFPPITEGAEMIMDNIEERINKIEKRILKNLRSFLIIALGSLFLVLSLFFFSVEQLGWSKAVSFLVIGVIILFAGLLLKLRDQNEKN